MRNYYLIDYLKRIKNYSNNHQLEHKISVFEQIDSINDIHQLCNAVDRLRKETNNSFLQIKCLGKESLYYGHLSTLVDYAGLDGYKPLYMPAIEHGINFHESKISETVINGTVSFLFQGPYKKQFIHNINNLKPVFTIGPYINYAKLFHGEEEFLKQKTRLGKVLTFFPFHTFEENNVARSFLDEIDQLLHYYGSSFDTIAVCLYWQDLSEKLVLDLEKHGVKVLSAGVRFDSTFLRRLKEIILLSDTIVGDDIGTYLGYARALGKKTSLLIDQNTLLNHESLIVETEHYKNNQRMLFDAIQKKENSPLYHYFWGCNIKPLSHEEMKEILEVSQFIVRKSHGNPDLFDSIVNSLLKDSSYSSILNRAVGCNNENNNC